MGKMIVEFAGLPRSGKSSCLDAVKDYYVRKGYNVRVLFEGSRTSPFSHRHRVKTAFWTANQVVNDIIEYSTLPGTDMLILQDRGLFDAMAFIRLLEREKMPSAEDASLLEEIAARGSIDKFLSYLSNWARFVDLVLLFETRPERVLSRDLASKMDAGPGIITNTSTLNVLTGAYRNIKDEYGDRFARIASIRPGEGEILETAINVKDIIDREFRRNVV